MTCIPKTHRITKAQVAGLKRAEKYALYLADIFERAIANRKQHGIRTSGEHLWKREMWLEMAGDIHGLIEQNFPTKKRKR